MYLSTQLSVAHDINWGWHAKKLYLNYAALGVLVKWKTEIRSKHAVFVSTISMTYLSRGDFDVLPP